MTQVSRLENIVGCAAVAAAALVPIGLFVFPVYSRRTEFFDGTSVASQATLYDVNGLAVLPILLLPALIAAIPLFFQRQPARRVAALACGIVLTLFCIIAGFSVGMYYLPSALLVLASGLGTRTPRTA